MYSNSNNSNNNNNNGYSEQNWNDEYSNPTGNDHASYLPSNSMNFANSVTLLSISHGTPSGLSDYHTQSRQASTPHYHARMAAAVARSQLSSASRKSTAIELKHPSASSTSSPNDALAQKQAPGNDDTNNNDHEQSWTILDMGGLGLKHLSPSLFRYGFLTTVYINHNQLTHLPSDISKLSLLEKLDCSGNSISALPPSIGQLFSLKELLLFDNQLVTLPNEVGMLYQLKILGLEGNPLQNDLQALLLNEGTQGLISSLREHVPVGPPPPSREWITIEETDSLQDGEVDDRFIVLCYNILCPRYVNDQKYGYTPSWALEWDYRKELILSEIAEIEADIICLQELARHDYDTFLVPYLKDHGGFDGLFYPKSRAKTMAESERKWVDGCAMFYKSSRYKLVDHLLVEFNKKGLERPDFKASKDTYNRLMPKDNIAVFGLLEDIKTKNVLVVANSQIFWDPAFSDVKLVQIGIMIDELCQFVTRTVLNDDGKRNNSNNDNNSKRYSSISSVPMLICGDLNSEPNSGVYEYLTKGILQHDHDEFRKCQYGTYTTSGLEHKLALKSGYSPIGELDFTNYTPDYKGALDYIFYTTKTLDPVSLLGPLDSDYMSKVVGLPNPHFPSDHIPVVTEFKFKRQTENRNQESRYPSPHSLHSKNHRYSKTQ
ncbi:Endonuclease/exonuclease/phosphatase [Absidia repens]|uniref:Endonuclease/exonuclease/phosphatase n=1 Tax=Absidia repens TaxID=90262 RepID=A0A1X2IWE5_9FUNG|nr:Endonuclease/exonuclease/phosphatase [Absidia repens]